MSKIILPAKHVQKLTPYKTSEAWRTKLRQEIFRHTHHQYVAKLDYNESPYPISPRVLRAVRKNLHALPLNWYPDPDYLCLKVALTQYHKGMKKNNFLITNGSAEGLAVIIKTYCNSQDEVLIISPTYDFVRYAAQSLNIKTKRFNLNNQFQFNFEKFKKSVNNKTKVVYLVNPNNPTGTAYTLGQIKKIARFLELNNTLLIVDEAYLEFTKLKSSKKLINIYSNILVTRTFSKAYGLANFRVGYILSHSKNIMNMEKICSEFPINTLSELAAIEALRDQGHLKKIVTNIQKNKSLLIEGLTKKGYEIYPCPANFLLVKVTNVDRTIRKLARNNIVARPKKHLPPLENFVRFSIGKKQDVKKIIDLM